MRLLLLAAAGLALIVTAADAQPRPGDVARPPIAGPVPPGSLTVNDPVVQLRSQVTTLQNRVRGLENRVVTLEEQMRRVDARTSFRCVNEVTSINGAGVTDDCGRYRCNPIDGRCRTSASDSSTCAPGFQWVAGDRCLLPSEVPG